MKKVFGLSLLMTTLLTTLVVQTHWTHAAVVDSATREATATIEAGDETQPPTPPIVDPTDPDDNTNNRGPLTLDYASHFEFGAIKLSGQAINQHPVNKVENNGVEVTPIFGAQVTDKRGTGDGWHLTVSLSPFEGTKENHILKGATLVLPSGTAVTDGTVEADATPTTNAVTLTADNQINTLFTATTDQGMGSWFDKMSANQIFLRAPSAQYADSYMARVSWSLQDAPA